MNSSGESRHVQKCGAFLNVPGSPESQVPCMEWETGSTMLEREMSLPKGFGTVSLKGNRFRDVEMDITLYGEGCRVERLDIRKLYDVRKENADREDKNSILAEKHGGSILFAQPGKYGVKIQLAL